MLTDNAIRPGAMALDNVRSFDTPDGGAGGGGMPVNPFDPNSPVTLPAEPGQVLNPDGTVSHGGPLPAEREGVIGEGSKGTHAAPGYTWTINGPVRNGEHPFTEGWVNPNAINPNYEDAMAPYYENLSRIAAGQGNPASSAANVAPTMYPGSTFWSGSTLMYNTTSGPVPATMIDPYVRADVMNNNPYNTTQYGSPEGQRMNAADPRSQNPNLNLNSVERSSWVRPPAPAGNGAVNFGQNAAGENRQTPGVFPIPTITGPAGPGTGTAASGGWNYTPGIGWSIQAPAASLLGGPGVASNLAMTAPRSAATNRIPGYARGGMIRGVGIVGDQPNGKPTGHEELVFAPQGAMVVPMNKIGRHAKGGAIDPFAPAPAESVTPPATEPQVYDPVTGTTSHGGAAAGNGTPMQNAVEPDNGTPLGNPMQTLPAMPATSKAAGGYTVINGPATTPPGTQTPNPQSADEVRRWRESFPIPEISGPNGVLNPFDVAWNNVDPTSRDVFYNARQTRFGIPAQSQAWEQQRYALPGMARPGWGY